MYIKHGYPCFNANGGGWRCSENIVDNNYKVSLLKRFVSKWKRIKHNN